MRTRHLHRYAFTLLLVLACSVHSLATWSIILIDPVTREIGVAGASCTYNCYGIGEVIPGKGAVLVQAMSSKAAKAKGLQLLFADATPEQIIAALRNPAFDPERQQYAVVSLKYPDDPKTYTGDSTRANKGALTARGVSVQGNTLANSSLLRTVLEEVLKAQREGLSIDVILMLALEKGAQEGGDRRCGEQKATTAFLTVAQPDDKPNKPSLNLVIVGQRKGGPNAVAMLRAKYDQWKAKQVAKSR